MIDEREENLREMAALGNVKAVRAYLRNGVDMDSQNKMNGWTAMHWACARGQTAAVELLLGSGADVNIKNHKGETALDLCKSDQTRALLAVNGLVSSNTEGESDKQTEDMAKDNTFSPNYLTHPDLSRAWGMPEDVQVANSVGESSYSQQLQREVSSNHAAAVAISDQKPSNERELLVYDGQYRQDKLLGSVFVSDNIHTVADLKAQINEELDGTPTSFVLLRYNGKQTVPVSTKQESFQVGKVYRGDDDAVVLKQA